MACTSLTELIERGAVTPRALALMGQPAIEAMALMRCECHSGHIEAASLWLDAEAGSVAIKPVGTEPEAGAAADIAAYGLVLLKAIAASEHGGHSSLSRFASQCAGGRYSHWEDARLALERSESRGIYWAIIALVAALLAVLWWLNGL